MTQEWKTNEKLYGAPTKKERFQLTKELDYEEVYVDKFLNCDPLKDWDSIERCIWLWNWAIEIIDNPPIIDWKVLDVGSKDGQFPEYLNERSVDAVGIEFSEPYVDYAQDKGRRVFYGDACYMTFKEGYFDFVFSHHLHGLVSNYLKALQEMFRVTNKYMLALNQVPGNPRKHYSYIDSPQIFHDFAESVECNVLYNDYLDTGYNNEWVIFLEKI